MKVRVIEKHGKFYPQYKFAGIVWRYCTEQSDPYRQPEIVAFDDVTKAIDYFSKVNNRDKEKVVWQSSY